MPLRRSAAVSRSFRGPNGGAVSENMDRSGITGEELSDRGPLCNHLDRSAVSSREARGPPFPSLIFDVALPVALGAWRRLCGMHIVYPQVVRCEQVSRRAMRPPSGGLARAARKAFPHTVRTDADVRLYVWMPKSASGLPRIVPVPCPAATNVLLNGDSFQVAWVAAFSDSA